MLKIVKNKQMERKKHSLFESFGRVSNALVKCRVVFRFLNTGLDLFAYFLGRCQKVRRSKEFCAVY